VTFAADSSVVRTGPGTYRGQISDGWEVRGHTNGGYLLCIALRAILDATGRPDPLTVTGHFLAPPKARALIVDVQVLREGRRFCTASAVVRDDSGTAVLHAVATVGDLQGLDDPVLYAIDAPPDLPPAHQCIEHLLPGVRGRPVQVMLHPADAGFLQGRPSGEARLRGWFRLTGAEPHNTATIVQVADSFPPTVYNLDLPRTWVATLELTVHVRARPAPAGWLRAAFETTFVGMKLLDVQGTVWDEQDRLVARSRQLAMLHREIGT
jgi:acyl-CoA thioesterase